MKQIWDILSGEPKPELTSMLPVEDHRDYTILKERGVLLRCVYEDDKMISALMTVDYLGFANINFLTDGSVAMTGMLIESEHRHFTALTQNPDAYANAIGATKFRAVFINQKSDFLKRRYLSWTHTGDLLGNPILEYHVNV